MRNIKGFQFAKKKDPHDKKVLCLSKKAKYVNLICLEFLHSIRHSKADLPKVKLFYL